MTKFDHKFPVIKFIYLNCGYVTHYVLLCLAGSENVLFRWISLVGRRSLYKQQGFSTCDWLLFLLIIITLRSLMMKLRRIYDEVIRHKIFRKSGPSATTFHHFASFHSVLKTHLLRKAFPHLSLFLSVWLISCSRPFTGFICSSVIMF